jgi:putative ABC transport system permease protein
MDLITSTNLLGEALIYSICVLGIIISFRVIGFPDLTIEGSFTLGGAIFAYCSTLNYPVWLALFCSILASSAAGALTATIATFLKINKLLSGIITVTILYSLNLLIMKGPNISLLDSNTVFTFFPFSKIIFLTFVFFIVFFMILFLLSTNVGLLFRATGLKEGLVKRAGFQPGCFVILGLMISNGLIGFSGSLLAQSHGFADISMGNGMLIIALTSMILGEYITRPVSVLRMLLASIVGSSLYILVRYIALDLGLSPNLLNFITGLMFLLILSFEKYHIGRSILQYISKINNSTFVVVRRLLDRKKLHIGSDFL